MLTLFAVVVATVLPAMRIGELFDRFAVDYLQAPLQEDDVRLPSYRSVFVSALVTQYYAPFAQYA